MIYIQSSYIPTISYDSFHFEFDEILLRFLVANVCLDSQAAWQRPVRNWIHIINHSTNLEITNLNKPQLGNNHPKIFKPFPPITILLSFPPAHHHGVFKRNTPRHRSHDHEANTAWHSGWYEGERFIMFLIYLKCPKPVIQQESATGKKIMQNPSLPKLRHWSSTLHKKEIPLQKVDVGGSQKQLQWILRGSRIKKLQPH